MPNYLLALTPDPIADADYPEAFVRMAACNAAYDDISWNGIVTFTRIQIGKIWVALLQMNDEKVRDNGSLTVVWSVNPFDHLQDRNRQVYLENRPAIIDIVDAWASDLGSRRSDGLYFDGDVCWILEGADTAVLTSDFANAKRARFKLLNGSPSVE